MNLLKSILVIQLFSIVAFAEIPKFMKVNDDLYRGGRPDQNGLEMVSQLQIRTVISIDDEVPNINWERNEVAKLDMNFFSHPMNSAYPQTDSKINAILAKLQDSKLQPIFIHCEHGRDRTGLIIGLYRVEVEGWTPKAAYKEMLANGFRRELLPLDYYFRKRTGYRGN